MRICAIVLNYRNAARTQACLCSLIGQGLDTVLVVDNSTERHLSDQFAAMLERQAGLVDYRMRLFNPLSNLGFARGVNLVLDDPAALQCDSFLIINNDAVALPDMVARLAARLADTGAAMVAPTVVDTLGKPQSMLWYQRFFGLLTAYPLPGSFPYLSGCCLLVRREVLEDSKLFDDDFFMYGEDALLGWRLACSGKVFSCANDAVMHHASGSSSRQGQLFYEYHTARAHVLLALKTWRSPIEIPILIVSKSIGLALRALRRSVRFRSGVPLLAFILSWFPIKIRVP